MTTGESTTTPAYDANGNMTTDQNGQQYVYNAWNQLVAVKNSDGDVIATYSYNGLGWQVTQTEDSTTTDLYYSSQWQVLQEQVSGSATASYVWSPVCVDALVCRDAGGTRLYALQDANWNVTALVDTSGTVQQRYTYTPFGVATALTACWETPETPISWNYLYQGQRRDLVTGLDNDRRRWYSPSLARYLTPDPTGFDAGQNNFYAVDANGPTNHTDPSGLEIVDPTPNGNAVVECPQQAKANGGKPNGTNLGVIIDEKGNALYIKCDGTSLYGVLQIGGQKLLFGKCLPKAGINIWIISKDAAGKFDKIEWLNIGPAADETGSYAASRDVILTEIAAAKKTLKALGRPTTVREDREALQAALKKAEKSLAILTINANATRYQTVIYYYPTNKVYRLERRGGNFEFVEDPDTHLGIEKEPSP